MTHTLAVLLLALCLLSASASAQTHPCDGPLPPTSATVTAGLVPIGWCHDGRDVNGNVTTFTGWALYANNVRTSLTGVKTGGVPNAAGFVFYEATVNFPQGNFQVSIAGINGQGEAEKTPPFQLNAVSPSGVPRPATRFRVS